MVIVAECNATNEDCQTSILWLFSSIFLLFFFYEVGWIIYGFVLYEKEDLEGPLGNYGPFVMIFGSISAIGQMLVCCLRNQTVQFDRQYNHLSKMREEDNNECGIKVDMTSSKIIKTWLLVLLSINVPLILFNILFYVMDE